jgi:hypothetical protein
MKINFTRKEMRSLLTIAGIAEEVLGVQARADGLFEMIDKILQAAGEMGMPDLVEYIPEHKTYYFSEEGQHALRYDLYTKVFYLNECRRNEAYSLAERDLQALHTQDELAAMDEDEKGEILEELCEKHYKRLTEEFLMELGEDDGEFDLEGEPDIEVEGEEELPKPEAGAGVGD